MKHGENLLGAVIVGGVLASATHGIQAQTAALVAYNYTTYAPIPEFGKKNECVPSFSESVYAQRLATLTQVYNRCSLAREANIGNLWNILSDSNQDGRVNKKDTGRISGNQLAKSLTDIEVKMIYAGKAEQFYQNITSIIRRSGSDVPVLSTKEAIVEAIQANPELIRSFYIGFNAALLEGVPLQYLLEYGEGADSEWNKDLQRIESHPEVGNLLSEVSRAEADLPRVIDSLLSEGKITDTVHKQALIDLRQHMESGAFREQILAQILSFAPAVLGFYSSSHAQVSLQNTADTPMKADQYKIRLQVGAGIQETNEGTAIVIMTGVGMKYQLDESSRLETNVGVNSGATGVFPVASFMYRKTLNQEIMHTAPISDTSVIKKNASVGVGTGIVGPYVSLGYSADRGTTLVEKVKRANALIDTAFMCEAGSTLDSCMSLVGSFVQSEAGKQLDILDIAAIRKRLGSSQFDTVNHARKIELLNREKNLVKQMYLEYLASGKLGETDIALTGVLLGAFGIMPNMNISWLNTENPSDPIAQAHAHLLGQGFHARTGELIEESDIVDVLHRVIGSYVKISHTDGILVLRSRNTYFNSGEDIYGRSRNLTEDLKQAGVNLVSHARNTRISQDEIYIPLSEVSNLNLNSIYKSEGWILDIEFQKGLRNKPNSLSVNHQNIVVADKSMTATPRGISIGAR